MRRCTQKARRKAMVVFFGGVFCFGMMAMLQADDQSRGTLPQQGYTQSGPPKGGAPGNSSGGEACNAGPAQVPCSDAALAELRKTNPALAAKMEKLMQDAKEIGEEAAKKAGQNAADKKE